MKVVDKVYILTSPLKDETLYLTVDEKNGFVYDYSFDIRDALKCGTKRAALNVKDDYEADLGVKSDLTIAPLKITYEW